MEAASLFSLAACRKAAPCFRHHQAVALLKGEFRQWDRLRRIDD
jgi:hypothetical protein